MVKTVKATREGLTGRKTAVGWHIDNLIPFVALPSTKALYKLVRVRNLTNNLSVFAFVLDVGPWNTHDDEYVFGAAQPQAESGTDSRGRPTNRAGIDLGEKVWSQLKMADNSDVAWEFVEL